VDEVIKEHSGGTQSNAAVAIVDGEKRFLKAQQPSQHGRYANFEADILAHDLFEAVGIDAPDAEIVHLQPGPLSDRLGQEVLSMEFVDSKFAKGDKIGPAGWSVPENADLDSFYKMVAVDILIGNPDRRDANMFLRETSDGKVYPVPIDNDSGFGNLITQKYPTNHCSFVKSYEPAGETPGIRMNGTIPSILLDTVLHYDLLDEENERDRMLEMAAVVVNTLDDEKIRTMVDQLPSEIIPRDTRISTEEYKGLDETTLAIIADGATDGLTGDDLVSFRKQELKETLGWRRDHLQAALESYLSKVADPDQDPIDDCSKDWNKL
jgi:CotH protein